MDFKKLYALLSKELEQQQNLLEILVRERASVVRMNPEELNKINLEKEKLLNEVRDIEERRNEVICALAGTPRPVKLSEVLTRCPSGSLTKELSALGSELRQTAVSVKDFHEHNAILLRQAMGLVASTVSILRGNTGSDLPTYSASGAIRNNANAASSRAPSAIVRSA